MPTTPPLWKIKSTGPNRVAEIRWISAGWELYLTRSLLSRMDPGARLGLGGGARACRLDSFFGFLVLPGLVDLIRFAVFAKNRTSGRHRLAPPGFV